MKGDRVSTIRIPIKKEYFSEINNDFENITSKRLTNVELKNVYVSALADLEFLRDYFDTLIERMKGMEKNISDDYIGMMCREFDNIWVYTKRLDHAFKFFKSHVGYNSK